MSISKDGKVRISALQNRNTFVIWVLLSIQFVLSIVLCVSLAANIIWPESSRGAAGTPMKISYEGRLTDSSGNSLGGTGTPYCFRLSIYDSLSAGAKLWPSAAVPGTTMGTTTDGVFSVQIGQIDTLTSSVFDFSTTSVAYLQVDVNTTPTTCAGSWESLSPRQEILSAPYALQSNNVYGSLLKTDVINNEVQVGTGVGAATPIFLTLDWKNAVEAVGQSCTVNGAMWYNSATSHALVCEAGIVQEVGTVATTTIGAITANAGAAASTGTVNFSNSNGVTFGINGNTITASVAAGGGVTLSQWEPYMLATSTAATSLVPASIWFNTINLPNAVALSRVNILKSFNFAIPNGTSVASTATNRYTFTQGFSIFTRQNYGANSTNLSYFTSASFGMTLGISYSSTSQSAVVSWVTDSTGGTSSWNTTSNSNAYSSFWTGLKNIRVPLVTTLSAGEYWIGRQFSSSSASTNGQNVTIASVSDVILQMPVMTLGNLGVAGPLAGWHPGKQGFGFASAFTTNNTMAMSVVSSASQQFPYFNFVNF